MSSEQVLLMPIALCGVLLQGNCGLKLGPCSAFISCLEDSLIAGNFCCSRRCLRQSGLPLAGEFGSHLRCRAERHWVSYPGRDLLILKHFGYFIPCSDMIRSGRHGCPFPTGNMKSQRKDLEGI